MERITPYHLGFKAGYRASRETGGAIPECPYGEGTKAAKNWGRGLKQGALVKVGRNKTNASPWCQFPKDCRATKSALCRSCNMKRQHADPAFSARRNERINRARDAYLADPVKRAKMIETVRAAAIKQGADPEVRRQRSILMRKRRKDPVFAAAVIAGIKKSYQGERLEDSRQRMRKIAIDPEIRKKAIAGMYAAGALSPRKRQKIADEARDSAETYTVIGERWGIGKVRVSQIALAHGVRRGTNWRWRHKKK